MILDQTNRFWVPEFFHTIKVLESGAAKHGDVNWMLPAGNTMAHKVNHNSMFHHLADSYANIRQDTDSKLDPLLHLACRAMLEYTRIQRGLVHPEDI